MSQQLGTFVAKQLRTIALLAPVILFLGACQKKGLTMVPVVAPVPQSQRPVASPTTPGSPSSPSAPIAESPTPTPPSTTTPPAAPSTPSEPGNPGGVTDPPPVVQTPPTEPTRYWWDKVVWGDDAKAFLESKGFDASKNCGQIVKNNDTLMLEISNVACPDDNSLVAWSNVKVTLFYQPGDDQGRRYIYHSDYPSTYLGYFTMVDDQTNTVRVEQLCSGDYYSSEGGNPGCHLDFTDGVVAGIGVDPGNGGTWAAQVLGTRARSRALYYGY